jgi:hypothetical protein
MQLFLIGPQILHVIISKDGVFKKLVKVYKLYNKNVNNNIKNVLSKIENLVK